MYYVVVRQSPKQHQMTLEEYLFDTYVKYTAPVDETNTRTYKVDSISDKLLKTVNVHELIDILKRFNEETKVLREVEDRHDLYENFCIPKKSGGLRHINAPISELKEAQRKLRFIFEDNFKALYHTSAFAYVKGRDTYKAIQRHQENESKWFLKTDLHDFFGSTTPEFVMEMFSMIFPFSEVLKDEVGKQEFMKAIDLAFLDGGLPQGTPLSPTITNIMMIPFDHKFANGLRDFNKQRFVYTRYADDFIISSKYNFRFMDIVDYVNETLEDFDAPFRLNAKKTRYGSSNGSNWNLGYILNKDNQITVGNKRKKLYKTMLFSYTKDRQHGVTWEKCDLQAMEGERSFISRAEPEWVKGMIEKHNKKYNVDVMSMIKADLRVATNFD